MASTSRPGTLSFVSADVTGKTHITFLFFFLSGEPDFFRVDDDDKIARVHVWCKNGFLFAAQQISRFHSDYSEHLVAGVDQPPFAWDFAGFGRKRFHRWKRARKLRGRQGPVNQSLTDLHRQLLLSCANHPRQKHLLAADPAALQ